MLRTLLLALVLW